MHAASLERSDRLQRVADVLADGCEHTTLDIITKARVCAVNSCVSEIRMAGHAITCTRRGSRWYYRMEIN